METFLRVHLGELDTIIANSHVQVDAVDVGNERAAGS